MNKWEQLNESDNRIIKLFLISFSIFICLFALSIISVHAVDEYSYDTGTPSVNIFDIFGKSSGIFRYGGQTFACTTGNNTITGGNIYIGAKTGTPESLVMELWEKDWQTGTLLRTKALTNINASAYNYFRFDESYTCTVGQQYTYKIYCGGCVIDGRFWDMHTKTPSVYSSGYVLFNNGVANTTYDNRTAHDLVLNITYIKPDMTPRITLLSDLKNGTVTNSTTFNFFFNQTSVNNSNNYFCGIYENTTLKNSINTTITGNKNLSFSLLGNYERYLNFTLNCFNENASSNLSALYYVDNVKNVLNYAYPNGTYYNDVPLYTNFSVTDTNLYSIEWLVYQGVTLKENITHTGLSGGTYNVYNLSAVSQLTGNYNWILNVWENHNPLTSADLFNEYETVKTENELIFQDTESALSFTIESKEYLDVKTETKDLKQYFEYTPLTKEIPKFYTYYVKSDSFIDYIKESKYKGHLVIWEQKKYIDFQCNDYVNVFKESDYLYRIETPCTKFETTGNLNFMQYLGNFTISTPPSLSDEYLLDIKNELITLNRGVNMLWLIIGLICVGFIPYFLPLLLQRTALYISIMISGVLIYIVEILNFFSFERDTQIIFDILLLGFIVIHVFSLFDMDNNIGIKAR